MTRARDPAQSELVAARLRAAVQSGDLEAYGALLDDDVRWGGGQDTPETCHSRAQVLERLASQRAAGVRIELLEVVPTPDAVLVGLKVRRPMQGGFAREHSVYEVLTVSGERVIDIRGYSSRAEAAARAGVASTPERASEVRRVVPILNVANLTDTFAWFAKLGWTERWAWGESDGPPGFGAVGSGPCEIFLCVDGQGGRGGAGGIGGGGQGVWLSVWIDDVDALHAVCQREGIEVLQPPRDQAFGVRELHIRHPDGHVFRMSQSVHGH